MRIAVTYENGQIFQHFGRTEQFKLYNAADSICIWADWCLYAISLQSLECGYSLSP